MTHRSPTADQSATELKRQIELERRGAPFLVFRDSTSSQRLFPLEGRDRIVIGRSAEGDVTITGDESVSRLHAEMIRAGGSWVVDDDGLSTNGTSVNGERIGARRRLVDRDLILVGETGLLFRDPRDPIVEERATRRTEEPGPSITEAQRRVLVELCRPLIAAEKSPGYPAGNQAIAESLSLSVAAVKSNLTQLFERFGLDDLPQNQKRVSLAEAALRSGVISRSELS